MFRKRVLSSLIVCFMLFGLIGAKAQTMPKITIESVNCDAGGEVVVPIKISDNTGICGVTLSIEYDSALTLTNIQKGSAFSSLAMTKPGDMSANPFNIVWDGTDPDNSNGTIALLTFKVPDYKGTFNVSATYQDGDVIGGNLFPVDISIENGAIIVGDSDQPHTDEPEDDEFTISVDKVKADALASVNVPITVSHNSGLCGATISVSYDKKLSLTGISKGSALSTLSMTKPGKLSANPFNIIWDGTDPDNSNGVMAVLTFTVPNEAGTYDISISYDDGAIVDGSLNTLTPKTVNGSIEVGTEICVTLGNETVNLSGNTADGKIIVVSYDKSGTMLLCKFYDTADSITADIAESADYVKVLWWDGLDSMVPVCASQTVSIKK
ncbi:MAG: hypothetical protein IJT23_01300 [Clostridia bacterium]|nr:hypothetical protein [Clostridia bacterium]